MKDMKKLFIPFAAVAITVGVFTGCNSSADEAKQKADEFNSYVDSVDNITPVYTSMRWEAIENGYEEKEPEDAMIDKLSEEEKKEVEESKAQYEALKTEYKKKIEEEENEQKLRNSLFGEGKLRSDMQFNWVTADNILDVYRNFVNTVAENKDSYSREDWDEIKLLYEALDTRKNEVEDNLSSSDNLKIAGLKIKFSAIKTVNRPLAKAEENTEAKQ